MSLAAIPTASLLSELQKRIECANKKERRTIFIGTRPPLQTPAILLPI
jgi:hypothetical protein